ncbi:glycosyltransferase family 4 protein [Winogradskyella flava]|uniref:Glycosyltransferase family 4 protein n=1 Tax=Winogradskyella flava TaxID=1884876 RepID=A0A842IVG6_9FLAO|nr:glycosyltransferase family 4 protein [Winogradskyella flava]MBC2846119.1 glycosyltransferase family 4 protein [Winogradskyella flava]
MKNVLYIGNVLSDSGKTVTTIETLSINLKEFCTIKLASNKTNKLLRLLDMLKLIWVNKTNTDYVLIDTYSTTNFYYAFIISQVCRVFRLDYIPILHGGNLEKRLKNSGYLSHLIFSYAHKLVTPSLFLKEIFNNYGYDNILYIPNNLLIENYEFKDREITDIELLWVRSFASIYNPVLAIMVMEGLHEKGLEARLTMIGPEKDGSLAMTKTLAKEKHLNVNFTGKLSKKEWVEISKKHNIFINTTNFDNLPVSVIEAMALGLPVVSTNVGGLSYLINHNEEGLLVPPNNVDAMVSAIMRLKEDNNLRKKIVINARNKSEQFDWEVVKPLWQSLLS